jgi:hypothetical protein
MSISFFFMNVNIPSWFSDGYILNTKFIIHRHFHRLYELLLFISKEIHELGQQSDVLLYKRQDFFGGVTVANNLYFLLVLCALYFLAEENQW